MNICIVTGNRAEFGLLQPLAKAIVAHSTLNLQLLVTGSHLSAAHGMTVNEIEAEFHIDKRVPLNLSHDNSLHTAKVTGQALSEVATALEELKPDLLLVLGDRFEIFAAVSAANILNIPVAHLHGGEITEGAFDDAFRHAITKMSQLHFTSTNTYRHRIIQMGEQPSSVYHVGSLGVELIKNLPLLTKEELQNELNLDLNQPSFMVTYHPETNNLDQTREQIEVLTQFLIKQNTQLIFTKANCDPKGQVINEYLDRLQKDHPQINIFDHLGQIKYYSILKYVKAVIGNSSSGIIEAPSFKVPTINIGDRQKGRIKPESIIDCQANLDSLEKAFQTLYSDPFQSKLNTINNPNEKANTCQSIIKILEEVQPMSLRKQSFYDIALP